MVFLLSLNFIKAFLCRKEVIATFFGGTQAHMEEWGVGRHVFVWFSSARVYGAPIMG